MAFGCVEFVWPIKAHPSMYFDAHGAAEQRLVLRVTTDTPHRRASAPDELSGRTRLPI